MEIPIIQENKNRASPEIANYVYPQHGPDR